MKTEYTIQQKFKIGDIVVRITSEHANMHVGDIGIVEYVDVEDMISIKEFGGKEYRHSSMNFEIIRKFKDIMKYIRYKYDK